MTKMNESGKKGKKSHFVGKKEGTYKMNLQVSKWLTVFFNESKQRKITPDFCCGNGSKRDIRNEEKS